jgi:hypothetical protein
MVDTLTEDVDLNQLLELSFGAQFQQFHAPIQARVNSYSTSPARVDAQPLVFLPVEGNTTVLPAPMMRSVPVAFQGGSLTAYTFPLTPGVDTVSLIPQDADIGAFIASGSVNQQPQSTRRFSLSDVIAVPNALRPGNAPLPAAAFAADGGVLWGLHYGGSGLATDFAAMALKVKSEIDAMIAAFNAHTHPTAATGPPSTPTPSAVPPIIPVPASGSTACTQFKVI